MTVSGSNPVGPGPDPVENVSVDGAVEPTPGERCFLACPHRHTANVQIFLQEFSHASQAPRTILLRDQGSGHQATSLGLPAHVVGLFLPPYSPERTPLERLGRDLQDRLAWLLFTPLEARERSVETLIRQDANAAMRSLTSSPYVVHAVHARCA